MALNELDANENVTEAPSDCNTSGGQWETGKKLFEIIQNQTLSNGTTGRVGFDEMGDRIYAEYQIVNVQMNTKSKNKMTVGYYNYSKVSLQFFNLLYIGPVLDQQKDVSLFFRRAHLVGTNSQKNFVPGAINSTAMIAAVIGHLLVNLKVVGSIPT